MNVAVASRLAVSPYARRLARDRNLPLEALRGSGPDGRILAADVLGFIPVDAPGELPAAAPAPSIAASSVAAFATSIALGALRELLAALESSGKVFDIDDILLRAAGSAFIEMSGAAKAGESPVALELGNRQVLFATTSGMPLTSLRAMRLAAQADARDDSQRPAALSVRLLPPSDIRPVMMPLLPGRAMRLTVSVGTAGDQAECLVTADTASFDETSSTAWLAALKSAVEHPLRLFV
ncbi:E3 binding domain-containing protein [Mesorhizobium sp. VK25A]|uniref:E3 binding domain-containing protein n=1 Tax=Mesorhizobium vachelliae TaxID=3072309 RepID=A0ABU5ABA6_9HYPH|nr:MULTISPECIES: E3 binding domain-containing protein [unclassified Mesorhizobium]MDX8535004.1 E3 binding domain-containing protein [Mesorhizobium sp. VK25D]MDX8547648.1 E3 binding domain-containing protein [Mesorhizobium sp. VK25A]